MIPVAGLVLLDKGGDVVRLEKALALEALPGQQVLQQRF